MEAKQNLKKKFNFCFLQRDPSSNKTQPWPKFLALVRATLWSDFADIGAQL